jgi:gliding motility-associated-like protein
VEVLEIPVFDLGNDTAFCLLGGSVELQGPPGLWKYSWSTGDTSASTVTSTPGMHWLSVQNQCFSYTDSIFVKGEMPIDIDLGPDTALCYGEVYNIDTEINDYPVQWSDGATGRAKNITSTGTYWARASNTCGVYTDSVKVSFDRPISEQPIDTVLCEGDSASYDLSFYEHQILWQDGSEEQQRSFKKEGIYPFTVINKCGEYKKEVIIVTNNCECPVYIANAFTPNDDGTNDQFRPIFDCAVLGYRFEIFDRWGMRVFLSHNLDEHWKGNLAGKPLPMGIYTFRLYYSFEVYGKLVEREERGSISLIR